MINKMTKIFHNTKTIAIMGIKGLPSKGGGERVAEAIIYRALKEGFEVVVYTKKRYAESFVRPKNLKLILINDLKGKHLNAFSFGILSSLHALLFGKYDLIHLHYADFGFIVPLLRLRFKIIGTSHGAEYNRAKWGNFAKVCFRLFEIPFVELSNVCTSVSKNLAEYYQKKYKKDVFYIPNGISFEKNEHSEGIDDNIEKHNLKKDNYILFCAGRIIPSKGCDILLNANRKLKLKIPIVIVGKIEDNTYKAYLKRLSGDNVFFINFLKSKKELVALISGCLFFVFPSLYEAMSMMLLEVAALKKGIICSDICENKEAIGDNALFFESGSSESLSEKLNYALKNAKDITNLGNKAYHWVKKHRNWDIITDIYIKIYKNILSI